MQKQTLIASVITQEEDKILLSLRGGDDKIASVYWPAHMLPKVKPGDEFFIDLSTEKQDNNKKPSEETLRNLLFELIN